MTKTYIKGIQDGERHGSYTEIKVGWTLLLEEARHWTTRGHAEEVCGELPHHKIRVQTSKGEYVCKDFQVEERGPGEFVIFCSQPLGEQTT